ncbi:hypothetical protein Scep_003396 [Stephania cephalantha]|uniref:DUF1279 domain-containing protein n=1 Tax=Stephania cephalantha TaxID=152367 RepID=A0AAP0KQF0_9MAGN
MASSMLFPSHTSTTLFKNPTNPIISNNKASSHLQFQSLKPNLRRFRVRALKETTKGTNAGTTSSGNNPTSVDEITEKFGLEAGLWKIFSSKDNGKDGKTDGEKSKGDQAKELLAKYGGAYLATSITLSLISFSLCYVLISAGIDVQALLQKVGIAADATGEKVGTFALAYAAHKAASPIRFPPTVALTPIVASWIGKKDKKDE